MQHWKTFILPALKTHPKQVLALNVQEYVLTYLRATKFTEQRNHRCFTDFGNTPRFVAFGINIYHLFYCLVTNSAPQVWIHIFLPVRQNCNPVQYMGNLALRADKFCTAHESVQECIDHPEE